MSGAKRQLDRHRVGRFELLSRFALRCFPSPFREKFSESMIDTLLERDREPRLLLARLGFRTRTLLNLVAQGLAERLRPSHSSRRREVDDRERALTGAIGRGVREARFSLRSLRRRPGFALLAVLTLALGIGANTAIFSVIDGVLLNPLPYPEPQQLVTVATRWTGPNAGIGGLSFPDLADIADTAALESLVGVNNTSHTLTGLGEPRVVTVSRLTEGLMKTFSVAPKLGRDLRADEFGVDGPMVVVIGHSFWQTHFAGSDEVLGRTVELSGVSYEIVGVAPPGFTYPGDCQLWIPRRLDVEGCGRGCHTMAAVGRLQDGAQLEALEKTINTLAASLATEFPTTNINKGFLVRHLQDQMVGEVRQGLLMLLGAVALVVLIACANIANLLMVRAADRTREVAIRTAIGADRGHLFSQALVESLMLALAGGVAGIALATATIRALPTLIPTLPRVQDVVIDGSVLAFTLATVCIVTLLFGTAPAIAFSRASFRTGLAHSGAANDGPSNARFRSSLLVAEVALTTLLLIGAGLVLKSFNSLRTLDLGFETSDRVRFKVLLPGSDYDSLERVRSFYRELEERARVIPGVEAVGSAWSPPLVGTHATGDIEIVGRPDPGPGKLREAFIKPIGPAWFETMGVAIVQGRSLDVQDDDSALPVAVINQTLARQHFSGESPIGRDIHVTVDLGYGSPVWRIVGVVQDLRGRSLEGDPEAEVYVPHGLFGPNDLSVTVKTRPDAPSPIAPIREIVASLDPNIPMDRIETLEEAVSEQLAPLRIYLMLISVFAGLAALLAAVGLYGVVSYTVSRRTRELGLRAALGATRSGLLRISLAGGMIPALLGLLMGLTAAWFSSRWLAAMLFGVEEQDPQIFLVVILLLFGVSLLATVLPAWRASRIDPASALRQE